MQQCELISWVSVVGCTFQPSSVLYQKTAELLSKNNVIYIYIYMLYKPQSTVIRAHTNISEGTSNLCIKSTKSEIDKKKKKKRKRNKTLCSDLVI